ncbi:MAG: hypothetical protein HY017_17305 [Betaproteobacteria bacterium]|nr:hypothetical protein [Betaproteobacteria bacterium]
MRKDPIVEEVRAAREALLKESGGTLNTLVAYLRRKQGKRASTRLVAYQPKKAVKTRKAA